MLQTRRFWSGIDLAGRLEVTSRTLRRDVDQLRLLGYKVEATSGPGGGYQLGRGTELPPLMLDEDEAVTVTVALQDALGNFSSLGEPALRLLVKLEQILPKRLQKRLRALPLTTLTLGRPQRDVDPNTLSLLASACDDQSCATFAYVNASGIVSTRSVEPMRLVRTGHGRWYLFAWDPSKEDFRLFRVDRIQTRPEIGASFVPKLLPQDLEGFVSRSLSTEPYAVRGSVRLRACAETARAKVPPWMGVIEPETEHSCILAIGAQNAACLALQLLTADLEFEVLSPESLRGELLELAARLVRASN